MALLAGVSGRVFGIGGGMFMSPILLHVGIEPQVSSWSIHLWYFTWSKMLLTPKFLAQVNLIHFLMPITICDTSNMCIHGILLLHHVYDSVLVWYGSRLRCPYPCSHLFVASLLGQTLLQRVTEKQGTASYILFSVGTLMALSTILTTSFGAIEVWRAYRNGKNKGFKKPC
ncbi:Sulfite exporter TauE/SafE family protein [Forsythia ovata]|uniref:Sulfite exporter TauE/SafE family protein n=1 Tax=Forsythia ovata TaxID=205694 RepID=A0ABD1S3K0_9LAMI